MTYLEQITTERAQRKSERDNTRAKIEQTIADETAKAAEYGKQVEKDMENGAVTTETAVAELNQRAANNRVQAAQRELEAFDSGEVWTADNLLEKRKEARDTYKRKADTLKKRVEKELLAALDGMQKLDELIDEYQQASHEINGMALDSGVKALDRAFFTREMEDGSTLDIGSAYVYAGNELCFARGMIVEKVQETMRLLYQ